MTRRDNLSVLLAIDDAVGKLMAARKRGRVAFGNSVDGQDATVQRLTSISCLAGRYAAGRRLPPRAG